MAAFYTCVSSELLLGPQVTAFTESDFSRTFKTGGSGGGTGTDHAWGSHQIVVGDAVRGGDFYGAYPTLRLGGPNDADAGSNPRGRWVPTTGIDQYAGTLAKWFGVSGTDLPVIFPNIGKFPTSDLGFMS
jgi:uncharacterized protein (DUF1501 family)